MIPYIDNTRQAVELLIKGINKEEEELNKLLTEYTSLKDDYDELLSDLSLGKSHDYFIDYYQVEEKFNRIDEFDKKHKDKEKQFIDLSKAIVTKEEVLNYLSLSLLLIAKKGIVTAYKDLSSCPVGRTIGKEPLKNVIWHGSNQAIYCEDGGNDQEIKACFKNLATDFGEDFNLSEDFTKSKAKHIISILDWKSYSKFKKDIMDLISQ